MKDFFKKSMIVFMFTVLAVLIIGKGFFVDNSVYEEYFNTYVLEENDFELVFNVNLYQNQDFTKEFVFDFDNFDYVLLKSVNNIKINNFLNDEGSARWYWSHLNSQISFLNNASVNNPGLFYDKLNFIFYANDTKREQYDVNVMLFKINRGVINEW